MKTMKQTLPRLIVGVALGLGLVAALALHLHARNEQSRAEALRSREAAESAAHAEHMSGIARDAAERMHEMRVIHADAEAARRLAAGEPALQVEQLREMRKAAARAERDEALAKIK
jgi:hypothetical protein